MMEFTWIGIDKTGKKCSGKLREKNKVSAISQLKNNHIIILSIKKSLISLAKKHLSQKEIVDFSEELYLLLSSGIPLSDALSLIQASTQHLTLSDVLKTLIEDLQTGLSFSASLEKHAHDFDHYYYQMIAAGENSGELTSALSKLIDAKKKQLHTQHKMKKACFYPLFVLTLSLMICLGMLIFIIPQFSQIYANFNATLPPMTQLILKISHLLQTYWQDILLFLLLVSPCTKNNHLKKYVLGLLNIPFLKKVFRTQQIAHWSDVMAMSLSSNIPLADAITIANQTLSDHAMRQSFIHVKTRIIMGEKLHMALKSCHYFPVRACHFIAIGENTDALSSMMHKVAEYYHQQFSDQLDYLSKLIEPVIMILVASLISGLIIAMYLPIFKMGSII